MVSTKAESETKEWKWCLIRIYKVPIYKFWGLWRKKNLKMMLTLLQYCNVIWCVAILNLFYLIIMLEINAREPDRWTAVLPYGLSGLVGREF